MTWVAPPSPAGASAPCRRLVLRTACNSRVAPVSSGADFPLQTTGARRRVPAVVPTTGMRAVSSPELKCRAARGDWPRGAEFSFTRKLA